MKKTLFILPFLICLLSLTCAAQNDEREPGLYSIVGDESIPLTYQNGSQSDPGVSFLGVVSVGNKKYNFKGATSNVMADSTFVLVCDMNKTAITRTLKKYDVFVKTTTPDNMIVIPLEVEKNKRVYSEGATVNGFNTKMKTSLGFEWERISDNSFLITLHSVPPGEYGFVFKTAKFDNYDFTALFGFTVTPPESEE